MHSVPLPRTASLPVVGEIWKDKGKHHRMPIRVVAVGDSHAIVEDLLDGEPLGQRRIHLSHFGRSYTR